ncbi:MAG: hypothetical protein Q9176_002903 [Flavoplaca citrina]
MAYDHAPAIRLTNPAAEFMDNHLGADFHPSLPNPNVNFDPAMDGFRPREDILQDRIYVEALKEKKAFLLEIEAFEREDRQHSRIRHDIAPESDWDAVLKTAENAKLDAEVTAIKGMSGAVRKLARRLGDAGPTFRAWLQMLPTDSYGSVICGGFKIIIDAAIKHKELCEEVFDALGDIPEVIRDAEFSFREYKSEALHKRVAKLYTVITETLKGILSFYKERASGRHMRAVGNAFKAIVKGSNYGRKIQADITNVKDSAYAVKQEAERCFQQRVGEMMNAQEYQTFQGAQSLKINTESINVQQRIYADFQYRQKCYNFALWNEMMAIKGAVVPKPSLSNGPSLRKIRRLLNTSPGVAAEDMEEVLREARRFPIHLQTQANQFMSSQELQEWLTSPYSRALLAQASDGDDKISALSFVASLLVQSFEASEDALALYFYCGLNTDSYGDSLPDATGMVQNIIAQLLWPERHAYHLGFINNKHIQALENGDLEALCDLLEGLTQQLPSSTTLFLVVDSISFYETRDRLEDTYYVMNRMLELVDKASFVFKLLITSPGTSVYMTQGSHHERVYWLPNVDPEEDDEFDHNIGAFRNQAEVQVKKSQMGLMRSDSEWMANA